jgi:hypothetical protein
MSLTLHASLVKVHTPEARQNGYALQLTGVVSQLLCRNMRQVTPLQGTKQPDDIVHALQSLKLAVNIPWSLCVRDSWIFQADHCQLGGNNELLRTCSNFGHNMRLRILRLEVGDMLLIPESHDDDSIVVDIPR